MATYINGYAFKPADWGTKGLPIIRIQNLTDSGKDYNYYEGEVKEKYLVRKGDVLISWSASIGVYEWEKEDAWLNQHIFKVVFDKGEVDKRYFKYATGYVLEKSLQYAHGSTMKHLTKGAFDKLPIPIYDLKEQRVIAEKIGKVDEAIFECEAMLADFELLVKSRFIEMFGDPVTNPMGWKMLTVEKAVEEGIIARPLDGNHGEKHPKGTDYVESGVPFIMANNLVGGRVDLVNCAFITEKQARTLRKGFAKDGDVLITHKGTIGRTAILKCRDPYVVLTPQVTYYRPLKEITAEYLKAYFDTPYFQAEMMKIAGMGTTRAHISILAQLKLKILLPPQDMQRRFVDFVAQADKSKLTIQKSMDNLQELRDSLLQEYFG